MSTTKEQNIVFCSECGQKNDAAAAFCASCGSRIEFTAPPAPAPAQPAPVQTAPVPAAPPAPKKPRKKMSKKFKVIACTILALAVVVTGLIVTANIITNPENVAKNYFKALTKGDYEKAFGYLSIEKSDFVNKENYKNYMKENNNEFEKVINYTVIDNDKPATKAEKELEKLIGSNSSSKKEEKLSKTFTVKYTVQGSSSERSTTIVLLKSGTKKFFFWDDYNVGLDNILVTDYKINAPEGSKVKVGGVEVKKSKDSDTNNISGYVTFVIPRIFEGKYELKIINALYEDYEEEISIGKYGYTNIYDFKLKEEIRTTLAETAKTIYADMFKGAIEGKSFDSLNIAVTSEKNRTESIKDNYEYFADYIKINDKGVGYKSVNIKSHKDKSTQSTLSSSGTYGCSVEITYDAVKIVNKNYWGEPDLEEQALTDKTANISMSFVYEEGKWVLQSISLGSSYSYN